MDKEIRSAIERATQRARKLLEENFAAQLEGTFDVLQDGRIAPEAGAHLTPRQIFQRDKIIAAIAHKRAAGMSAADSIADYRRDAAFTTLNRFVALKMLEARELVQECISKGGQSAGYREFCGMAPGVALLPDAAGYRLYIESLFDELSTEVKVLFNRRDAASVLWPKRACFESLLDILNVPELASVWGEDETIGWIYQYWNDPAERKKMREESAAPRNSRELAVRNQFFTPRYVVEFLTDNTLGRIWYEMSRGETALRDHCRYLVRRPTEIFLKPGESAPESANAAENLSQEELLRQPVHIPHRPFKDPREIRLLDPACGSMHFGLYAFDLFTVIYDEAWEIAHGMDHAAKSAETFAPFVTFAASFADKAAFLREVPRLIVEHNIHGIDIDPRAAQIAGLSLWLRAQRAWNQAGVKPADRPRITRSNIVCAEPMPGEKELLREFVEQQFPAGERSAFAFLMEKIFDRMSLAGEAGSLLRIEEEIRTSIAEARALAQSQSTPRQTALWPGDERPEQPEFDLRGLNDEQFWQAAEQRIYGALEAYAEQAEKGGGFQRCLFADDAAQGFAFIDVCRKRYDVVVMNPPFGEPAAVAKVYIEKHAGVAKADIYTAFLARCSSQIQMGGRLGAITPRSFIYQVDFHDFRQNYLLKEGGLPLLAELGFGELDGATNRTAAYVIVPSGSPKDVSLYANVSDEPLKAERLHAIFHNLNSDDLQCAKLEEFDTETSSQLLFRLSQSFRTLLSTFPKLDPVLGKAHKGARNGVCNIVNGLQCPSDFRYVRLTVEVSPTELNVHWMPFLKPIHFAPYVSELACVVDWNNSGVEQKVEYTQRGISPSKYVSGENFYPSRGVWFPDVSERGIGAALIPFPAIPGRKGLLAVGKNEDEVPSDALAGFLNSLLAEGVLGLTTPERHHKPSYMGQIPWVGEQSFVQESGSHYWRMCELAGTEGPSELSCAFVSPALLTHITSGIRDGVAKLVAECDAAIAEMQLEQSRFDDLLLRQVNAGSTDIALLREMSNRAEIREWFPTTFPMSESAEFELVAGLTSYWTGVAFGRWDIRYATGERSAPELPDPFAPLPGCPSGMLQGDDGLPLSPEAGRQLRTEGCYPLDVAWDGILVDDPELPLDLERHIKAVLGVLWGERLDELEIEACELLGVSTLRVWFRQPTGFFADHLKRYSKSRRQAPIYWPLSTASGSYSVWIYYHRFSKDTLFKALEQVKLKVHHEEGKLAGLTSDFGGSPSAMQRKELATQEGFVFELRAFHEELGRVAPLWNPDLNDGAIINYGPLWRMIAYKPWQKAVKACWDDLVAGKYDWAHLAMHLWPERVVPKCATDRSLAIAHGLDDIFWVKGEKGKYKAHPTPDKSVAELVRDRTSPAVKAALNDLLAATAVGSSRASTRSRKAR
jgi:hypothetical protein